MALTQVPIELSSTPGIVDNSNTTAITIDSSENVLVGTDQTPATLITTSTTSHEGVGIADGYLAIARNLTGSAGSGGVAFLNRLATDGPILDLRKDGTTIGSIGVESGDNFIIEASATDHAGLLLWGSGGSGRVTSRLNGSEANGTVDLGRSASRWKNLYLSGGAYLGGTGSANYLDDYEEGTWTPALAGHYGNLGTTFTQGTRNGVYTKIGNLVALGFEFTNAGVAAANNSDIVTVTGLPFSISGYGVVGSHAASAADSHVGGSWTSITGNTLGNLGNDGTKSDNWGWQTGANFSTSFSMRVTVIYRTTQ